MADYGETGSSESPRPLSHPWRRFWLLAIVVLACTLVCRAHIHTVGGTYLLRYFIGSGSEIEQLSVEDIQLSTPGVVEVSSVGPTETADGLIGIGVELRSIADGTTFVTTRTMQEGTSTDIELGSIRVEDGVIIADDLDFSGFESIYFSTLIVIGVAMGLFISLAYQLGRRAWYSYQMIAAVGGTIYLFVQLAVFVALGLLGFVDSFFELAYTYGSLANFFVLLSIPVMGVMMLALALSNISLIRHEGFRPVNMLGIALAVLWAIVMASWFFGGESFAGSYEELRLQIALECIISSAISYGVALFLATVLCAWRSTRHRCSYDKEYLIILGCGLRDDGTPMPLLRGRIDRALAFEREQYDATGRHATFVPSGGKGDDEIWSEAEAMRRYLVAAGVDESRIICEDRSTNTRENMAFSRECIDAARTSAGLSVEATDGFAPYGVAFATTNYHVFRGYTFAHAAGLAAEGLGAKTKAYFWPNAFLREFAGLLVAERWPILLLFLAIALTHAVAAFAFFK